MTNTYRNYKVKLSYNEIHFIKNILIKSKSKIVIDSTTHGAYPCLNSKCGNYASIDLIKSTWQKMNEVQT